MSHPLTDLTVGLIGAGGISAVHADAWRALGARVLVHSVVGAQELADAYGFTAVATLDEVLDAADIVDIVTPSGTHREIALRAIDAGVHVICEKPLAATAEDARDVAAAAERAGVRLFPAHVVRYFAEYHALREQVRAGRIGRVATQRFTRMGQAPSTRWFFDEAKGGGVVRDLMIHDLDQAVWLAGDVTEVYAVQHPASVDGQVPVPVTAHVTLTHANGVLSHLQATWLSPGMPFRTSIEVSGDQGRLSFASRDDATLVADVAVTDDAGYMPPMSAQESPYYSEIAAFVAAIRSGGEARVSPADGIAAVALAEAAMASIRSGQPVTLTEVSA
ncbi:Gfo/Idh/MocA family protein [Microbacterium nymphoidis]|uniref:Gfo/Idh/MocA family protein n=1 Tax=Microbacterium nymphoidis TaxID=2898586 RepID=UPI001E50998E|nr:Gfo/Idh/MocA family oxidoreductase [Microbacterium nymphoidis]MCD2499551.1 Gfo/Idh/MocA family oxidoreductase [Microbacterium nymphoidis]